MGYTERRVAPGVEVWASPGTVGAQRILPDGCLDVILDGDRIIVAGPDAVARVVTSTGGGPLVAVRLHGGRGPALLGLPADALLDRFVGLDEVWGDRRARDLWSTLAADPIGGFTTWARAGEVDPLGPRLRALLRAGRSVGEAADELGYSARQLHRRAVPLFGYGPQHLARILRLARAVEAADRGLDWASVAAGSGYADQAHLARDVRALTGVTPTTLRRERVRSVQDAA